MGTGQIAYTEQVDNYLGYYSIDGFSLGEKFREHADKLGAEFAEGCVSSILIWDGASPVSFPTEAEFSVVLDLISDNSAVSLGDSIPCARRFSASDNAFCRSDDPPILPVSSVRFFSS